MTPITRRTALTSLAATAFAKTNPNVRHGTVYRENERFAGWPANNGLFHWGDEILVGFTRAWYKKPEKDTHHIDRDRPSEAGFARSTDGGESWKLEVQPLLHGATPESDCPGMDFSHPDFAMTIRTGGSVKGASRFFRTTDRGRTWQGPYSLPLFGRKGIDARTDYIIDGPRNCTLFLTAKKEDGKEGRVFCTRTTDGGKSWKFLSWIGPEPAGFAIMPSTVRLDKRRLLTTIRVRDGEKNWIDAYLSTDNGASWKYFNRPAPETGVHSGNPPSLLRLKDGRLSLIHGYRAEPFGMRARLSGDEGQTWGEEIHLRDDAAAWDLGYPRSMQRSDGQIVAAYYYTDSLRPERYIASTIWDPGKK
ncbi:MAG: sialidase family protein [Acidobacteria bacterium]|nr:sialidase family protein [Acidobacteriota bacterium]